MHLYEVFCYFRFGRYEMKTMWSASSRSGETLTPPPHAFSAYIYLQPARMSDGRDSRVYTYLVGRKRERLHALFLSGMSEMLQLPKRISLTLHPPS